jgi:2-polyprenyl-3-methyl-5-hydroxy-6-metoxy-1,4-benzoquinol methylase
MVIGHEDCGRILESELARDGAMNILRSFIQFNMTISDWFDRTFLDPALVVDGNSEFSASVVHPYVSIGAKVYDVGGGKNPFFTLEEKERNRLSIVGIDISKNELDRAPAGIYDESICADISTIEGREDGDIVVCQAVLEHVADTRNAIRSISTLLKTGGTALIFVPSRNALFARLNLIIPETLKRYLLFSIYPNSSRDQGFRSYYKNCTPKELLKFSAEFGLAETKTLSYYMSGYFRFLFPVHIIWRIWLLAFIAIDRVQASETFTLILRRK